MTLGPLTMKETLALVILLGMIVEVWSKHVQSVYKGPGTAQVYLVGVVARVVWVVCLVALVVLAMGIRVP